MSLSRVKTKELAKQNKKHNTTNRKRLVLINVSLLAIITIVVIIFTQGDNISQAVSSLFKQNEKSILVIEPPILDVPNEVDEDVEVEPNKPDEPSEAEQPSLEEPIANTDDDLVLGELNNEEVLVNLAFVGDILQGEYIHTLLKEHGYSYPYQKALFSLSSADYTIGNLEMPITKNGQPMDSELKSFVFKGQPEALSGLVDAGIDLVTLANNHTLDQGLEGLYDTMTHLDEYGIKHIGAGKNSDEAYQPHVVELNGIKVAFLAASWVLPVTEWKATIYQGGLAETYDATKVLKEIEQAKQNADIVVFYVHWGVEKSTTPEQMHVNMAKKYIDAGADLIVGSHAHVLQGFEEYNGKWVAYNLGNFVFSAYPKKGQAETGVLNATCNKSAQCELSFVPMKTIVGQPTPLEGEAREELLAHLESISIGGVKVDSNGRIKSEASN